MLPPKKRGRPRKYQDPEEARKANIEATASRRKAKATQSSGPVDFIAFEPSHPEVPVSTPLTTSLRTSIQIPYDAQDIEEDDIPEDLLPLHSIQSSSINKDNNTATQIELVQINKQLDNLERSEQATKRVESFIASQIATTTNPIEEPRSSESPEEYRNNGVEAAAPELRMMEESTAYKNLPQPSSLRSPSIVSNVSNNSLSIMWGGHSDEDDDSSNVQRLVINSPLSQSSALNNQLLSNISLSSSKGENDIYIDKPNLLLELKSFHRLRLPSYHLCDHHPFQGCTHNQHHKADHSHRRHHQRSDVHSECSSLPQITALLKGDYIGGSPLPNVLNSSKLMKARDCNNIDFQAAFEGTSASAAPEDNNTRNENLPKNLCLSQHYTSSKKNRLPKITFDIDSTCCFPSSLAFAKCGINWLPKAHAIFNIKSDIHFGLRMPKYNDHGILTREYTPLHKIPHYCFGSVIGIETLYVFIFFPNLHLESDYYKHSTYLSKQDDELFYDAIVGPALNKIIKSSNIVQHYPASAKIADLDSIAVSTERLSRKESARVQLIKHTIQPQYLDALWNLILKMIDENPGFDRFRGANLFANLKNTKLEFMDTDLVRVYNNWQSKWFAATDAQFYNRDRTYVDLAKQVTSEDSALPYDHKPEDHEAEVYLWKKCCLEAYAKTRVVLNANGSPAKGNPKCTVYPWAAMRDTAGQTMFAVPNGGENRDGLIYSQFYGLIKTPFDSSKVYVFENDSVENLALDPGYIQSLQQEGGGITFSKARCESSYLHSKTRASTNLVDNGGKSYGIREEHRISLTIMEDIYHQWQDWDLYNDEVDSTQSSLPYYIIPTRQLFDFLSAQINKYCLLFEHILANTGAAYSLPETIVMVIALRALRFCYGSNLIQRESLLYKDRWEPSRGSKRIIKEGLEYLHVLNIEQFDLDIWKAMLKAHKRSPELAPDAVQNGVPRFCYKDMKEMFIVNGLVQPPHFATGNKTRFDEVSDLLNFLFLWQDDEKRLGWNRRPYRVILQKTFILIKDRLGHRKADQWLNELFHLIRLTHWVLPYPSEKALITSTKTNRKKGLKGRMMWFPVVYNPKKIEFSASTSPILSGILQTAQQQIFGSNSEQPLWSVIQIFAACVAQGIKIYEQKEAWVLGKRSGKKGFRGPSSVSVWEPALPPKLKMLEQIKERSLSELEDLMRGFVEQANSISDIQERNDFQEQEDIQMQEMIQEKIQEKIQERIQAKEDNCRPGRLSILITRSSEFAAPQKCNRKVNNQRAEQETELYEEVGSREGSVYEPPSSDGEI
ncbi:uncharacterized protein Bfra_001175 [Botrytis fragariae]|uniref:Uncharacterized protein n=1 Tax=Botrytis fragariae TaxID=1964551 RepID=A0A8H6ENS3_9HELO|nr:uncharacterized protein Bfra_001175 [Botrytis fragariae]KAF5879002.1 hypothetical protein Bfra_001175 [Botrytis fragariae]